MKPCLRKNRELGEKHTILDDIIALTVPEHTAPIVPPLPGTFVPIPFLHDSLVIYRAVHMSMHSLGTATKRTHMTAYSKAEEENAKGDDHTGGEEEKGKGRE